MNQRVPSSSEMARRTKLTQDFMDKNSLDAILGHGGGRKGAYLFWLTGHRELQGGQVVIPRHGEALLLVAFLNHLPTAAEHSRVPTEWGGEDPMAKLASRLQSERCRRVGIVGEHGAGGFSYLDYLRLRELCGSIDFVDVSARFDDLLLVKSAEEIDAMRESARLTDLALAALVEEAVPGIPEYELVARMEFAYRRQGGEVGITFLRSMPMDSPTGIVPAQRPSSREIAVGDVVICEVTAVYQGYGAQVLWPVFVGCDPTPEWQQLFDSAYGAYQGLVTTVKDGATARDAVAVGEEWIVQRGYSICDSLVHGCGLTLHPPYVEPDNLDTQEIEQFRFQTGMTIVMQPNPITRDGRMGIQLGAACLVGPNGAESLHAIPDGPLMSKPR